MTKYRILAFIALILLIISMVIGYSGITAPIDSVPSSSSRLLVATGTALIAFFCIVGAALVSDD